MGLQIALPRLGTQPDMTTDAVLVRRALGGDAGSYDALVHRYQRQVYSLLYRMLGNPCDAEDMAQETFIRAYRALHTFRQDASFLTWLYKIASNLSVDLIRSRRSKSAGSLDEEIEAGREPAASSRDTSPEDAAIRGSVGDIVHQAIMELPDKYRRVVLLRHVADMSIEEIAEQLELPTGTVKTHLFRARALMRERLGPVLGMNGYGTEQPA